MKSIFDLIGELVVLIFIIYILYKLLTYVWTNWLAYSLGYGVYWKGNHNTWAIVTGASEGIGFEFAKKMAAKNYAVLLISRNINKLNLAKNLIETEFPGARLRLLPLDLSVEENFIKVSEVVDEIDNIDVLINNCGLTYTYPEYFTEIPDGHKTIESILSLNVIATTKMLQIVLPKMVARNRGIVLNMSSLSAIIPTPFLTVYSASKIYVDYLSRALSIEYARKGIIIQSLMPGYCKTGQTRMRESLFVPSARKFVDIAIKTVGIEDRTIGYWAHKLIGFGVLLSVKITYKFITSHMLDVKKRYQSKLARDNKKANSYQS